MLFMPVVHVPAAEIRRSADCCKGLNSVTVALDRLFPRSAHLVPAGFESATVLSGKPITVNSRPVRRFRLFNPWRRVRGLNPRVRLRHVTGFQDRSLPARPTLLMRLFAPRRKRGNLAEGGGVEPPRALQPNLALAGQCLTTRPPFRRNWSPWRESNPQPAVYKTAALPD